MAQPVTSSSPIPPWLRGLARAVRRLLGVRALAFVGELRRTWRRSLQVRVVTITLLASSLLVGGFAYLV
ncbi:MAG TPA: hypothetical protein VGD43_00855, partial [Micromonospora sp.]